MGSKFLFEMTLETMRPQMLEGFRKFLAPITPADIHDMVRLTRFPDTSKLDFSMVGENSEFIEGIDMERLIEFLIDARPDLVEAINQEGVAGGQYLIKLREHMISKVKAAAFKAEKNIKMAHCDVCDGRWPVDTSKGDIPTECPLCKAKAQKEKATAAPPKQT